MIGLIQRVTQASVHIEGVEVANISSGALVLLGVEHSDDTQTCQRFCQKLLKFRMFSDDAGKMNLNIQQVAGEILVVSQFTLVADTHKGNRPGFSRGASPEQGKHLYQQVVEALKQHSTLNVKQGVFAADMQIHLINDGPVTFHLQVS